MNILDLSLLHYWWKCKLIQTLSVVKNLPVNAGDAGDTHSVPGLGRSLGRKWQPTLVFLPGKSRGQRSLAGYSPWGCKKVGHNWACTPCHKLQRTVWKFLKKLKIELLRGPAIPLLGIYPEKTIIQKDIYTPVFIAVLFTIARTWK